jgi:mannose-1-phosphate guanylyltransferase
MHLILLSGGSGRRLWPLSNGVRAKQFLRFLKTEAGEFESMAQRVYRQIKSVDSAKAWDSVTVAAGSSQIDQIRLQLGYEIDIVAEPDRRDTFPAIALACAYLQSKKGVGRDEIIAVLPVDPFVNDDFFHLIGGIEDEFKQTDADLVLLGSAPLHPSEKYGYIIPERSTGIDTSSLQGSKSERVNYFKEKPELSLAQKLITEGALWNCGVFGLRLGYVLDILKSKYGITDTSFAKIYENFGQLNKTSFDYEVVEKAENIRVLRYNGPWKDLGTWETFTEEIDTIWGSALLGECCENTHVINELSIPVTVLGLTNTVVVAGYDGILVAEKGETYRLKEAVAELQGRTMFEERRWGSYKVLEHDKFDETEVLTKKIVLSQGKQISYQYHSKRKEIWTILSGEGVLYFEGEKKIIKAGDVVSIGVGEKHGISAVKRMEIIELQIGSPLIEEDIVRLEYDWTV